MSKRIAVELSEVLAVPAVGGLLLAASAGSGPVGSPAGLEQVLLLQAAGTGLVVAVRSGRLAAVTEGSGRRRSSLSVAGFGVASSAAVVHGLGVLGSAPLDIPGVVAVLLSGLSVVLGVVAARFLAGEIEARPDPSAVAGAAVAEVRAAVTEGFAGLDGRLRSMAEGAGTLEGTISSLGEGVAGLVATVSSLRDSSTRVDLEMAGLREGVGRLDARVAGFEDSMDAGLGDLSKQIEDLHGDLVKPSELATQTNRRLELISNRLQRVEEQGAVNRDDIARRLDEVASAVADGRSDGQRVEELVASEAAATRHLICRIDEPLTRMTTRLDLATARIDAIEEEISGQEEEVASRVVDIMFRAINRELAVAPGADGGDDAPDGADT